MNEFKIIKTPSAKIMSICGLQVFDITAQYHWSQFVIIDKVDDKGWLYYNCLTGGLVFVSDYSKSLEYLVQNWYLIHNNINEKDFIPIVHKALKIWGDITSPGISYFEILTTTDCNARCFYCYEKGTPHSTMSEKTALKTVDFITKNKSDRQLKIRWYGGEPLLNTKAIDIISNGLRKNDIDYHSIIITNGLLFSEDNIRKAIETWNVNNVRITLDGQEDFYNKTKAYSHFLGNPFQVVIKNIEGLLQHDIDVTIRLNIESHNIDDIASLVMFLTQKHRGITNLNFSINLLNNTKSNHKIASSGQFRMDIEKKAYSLKEKIYNDGFLVNFVPLPRPSRFFCLADNKSHILITPKGELAFCAEDFSGGKNGTIYDESISLKRPPMTMFKYSTDNIICQSCPLLASCIPSKLCPAVLRPCDIEKRELILKETLLSIRYEYTTFLKTNN